MGPSGHEALAVPLVATVNSGEGSTEMSTGPMNHTRSQLVEIIGREKHMNAGLRITNADLLAELITEHALREQDAGHDPQSCSACAAIERVKKGDAKAQSESVEAGVAPLCCPHCRETMGATPDILPGA